jgi:hypothetical protein
MHFVENAGRNSMYKFKVGEVVYEPYSPLKYGLVKSIRMSNQNPFNKALTGPRTYEYCTVTWKDGTTTEAWGLNLKSLDALLATTEKKANTHRGNIEKARKL